MLITLPPHFHFRYESHIFYSCRTTGGGLPNPEAVLSPSDARILAIVGKDCSVGCRSPAVFGMAPAASVSPAPSPAPQASQVMDEHDYCSVQENEGQPGTRAAPPPIQAAPHQQGGSIRRPHALPPRQQDHPGSVQQRHNAIAALIEQQGRLATIQDQQLRQITTDLAHIRTHLAGIESLQVRQVNAVEQLVQALRDINSTLQGRNQVPCENGGDP
ncbi:uncharacterized protein LOC144106748 [Amblyomma americanum]